MYEKCGSFLPVPTIAQCRAILRARLNGKQVAGKRPGTKTVAGKRPGTKTVASNHDTQLQIAASSAADQSMYVCSSKWASLAPSQ